MPVSTCARHGSTTCRDVPPPCASRGIIETEITKNTAKYTHVEIDEDDRPPRVALNSSPPSHLEPSDYDGGFPQVLLQLIEGLELADDHEWVSELLGDKPAEIWIELLRDTERRLPISTEFSDITLRLLRGRITLYEAVVNLGPEWKPLVSALQALAQQRLFTLCAGGIDMREWPQSIEALTRSGARLLRADSESGQTALHLAVDSGSDAVNVLVRAAPASLLVQDEQGRTPLELLAGSSLLGNWGSEIGALEALGDAALDCLASLPKQTSQVLHHSQRSLMAWEAIAESTGCGALLAAWDQDPTAVLGELVTSAQVKEGLGAAKLRHGMQRVAVLRSLTKEHAEKLDELEPEELKLRLVRAETLLEERETAHSKEVVALKAELRQHKATIAQREEELAELAELYALSSQAVAGLDAHSDRRTSSCKSAKADSASAGAAAASEWPALTGKSSKKSGRQKGHGTPQAAQTEFAWGREQSFIAEIQRTRLGNEADLATLSAPLRAGVNELRISLAAAVDRLARDLYESEAHFLQELLQNADDNRYGAEIAPSICFTLRKGQEDGRGAFFYSSNNEEGLSESDVRAICDISRSSKSASSGVRATTGCKGVGWKSVFRICDTPYVLSQGWRFRFSSKGLGMLTPEWVNDADYAALPLEVRTAHMEGKTVFYLPISDPGRIAGIETEMQIIENDAAHALFFRRLREIRLCGAAAHSVKISVQQTNEQTMCVRAIGYEGTDSKAEHDLSEECVQTCFAICRKGDVTVAAPLVENPPMQRVFAFLPVRPVGFRFAVHAPFELTASRTDVHRSHQNARRRGHIAQAFLHLCETCDDVAAQCLTFLGVEPAEPFWHSVRTDILAGLKGMACIRTESGRIDPEHCVIRGRSPAAHWVPENILHEACGLSFAANDDTDTLRELGVREFGFSELAACLRHNEGMWLRSSWQHPSRSELFSDIYRCLSEAILADPSRLDTFYTLKIFPVQEMTQANICLPELSTSMGLYSSYCSSIPIDWQCPLVKCVNLELKLSASAEGLLHILGVCQVEEVILEQRALRALLAGNASDAGHHPDASITWAALCILRRCLLLGREAPRPWCELYDSVALPSATGELQPPSRLRMWSFLGQDFRLPKGVVQQVFDSAGIRLPDPRALDHLAKPTVKPQGQDWHLGWEVFLFQLGCRPPDPVEYFDEGLVESTLTLGAVLTSRQFWQNALQSHGIMEYLLATFGPCNSCAGRRRWMRQLPVRMRGQTIRMKDMFLSHAFRSIGGSHLPYLEDIPKDLRISVLLQGIGVAVEVTKENLLKCLRWLRASANQDIGIVADVYERLGSMGFLGETNSWDDEILFVPGRGYLRLENCSWLPFESELLRHCCRLEPLCEHYGRFGPTVCSYLRSWVQHTPASNPEVLCDTLRRAILIAKHPYAPAPCPNRTAIDPTTASRSLFDAARTIVGDLASLLEESCPEAKQEMSNIIQQYFRSDRMIVVPNREEQERSCVVLHAFEAYWSVKPGLSQHSCARFALEPHYGTDERIVRFFKDILGVLPELSHEDLFNRCSTKWTQMQPSPSHSAARPSAIHEGLASLVQPPTANHQGNAQSKHVDPLDILRTALQRAAASSLPDAHGSSCAERALLSPKQAKAGTPAVGSCPSSPTRRTWCRVGKLHGMAIYAVDGISPPYVARPPDVGLISALCNSLGLALDKVAFAYDPSGRCVCDEHLFLDWTRVRTATKYQDTSMQAGAIFWLSEICHALAHQGIGPFVDERFLHLQSEVLAWTLPQFLCIGTRP